MSELADFLMRNRLDALEEKPEYTTADVNALMPKPSWQSPLAGLGSYQLSQEAGAEPNWFGRNVLSNIPPAALHALNFALRTRAELPSRWENTYHGTGNPMFKLQDKSIWSGSPQQAQTFAASHGADSPGAIAPLRVDTSDYLPIRSGGRLEALDETWGSGNQRYNSGRNWIADLAGLLGKKGVDYESLFADRGRSILSLDPRTVQPRYAPTTLE